MTVTSGNAIVLENENNLFRTFTANGVEQVNTDENGNVIKDEEGNPVTEERIDGSVLVQVHAGSNLDASVTDTVYGNVLLKNLDAGRLTVLSDVTAKEGKNGETGSIVFKQQGDILVKGTLQADGYVTEEGYEETEQGIVGAGTITNEKDIQAGKDVTLRTTSGDIHTLGTITAAENVIAASTASTDGKIQISGDVFATNITVASLGASIITEKYMDASQDVTVKTLVGDIDLQGTAHAGQNIELTSGTDYVHGNRFEAGKYLAGRTCQRTRYGYEYECGSGRYDYFEHAKRLHRFLYRCTGNCRRVGAGGNRQRRHPLLRRCFHGRLR